MCPDNVPGPMQTPGAREELIGELRRLGPRYAEALEMLGLTLRHEERLPGAYAVDVKRGLVTTQGCDEISIWAAIAHVVAVDIGIEPDLCLCLEVAVAVCRRSGVFNALRIA